VRLASLGAGAEAVDSKQTKKSKSKTKTTPSSTPTPPPQQFGAGSIANAYSAAADFFDGGEFVVEEEELPALELTAYANTDTPKTKKEKYIPASVMKLEVVAEDELNSSNEIDGERDDDAAYDFVDAPPPPPPDGDEDCLSMAPPPPPPSLPETPSEVGRETGASFVSSVSFDASVVEVEGGNETKTLILNENENAHENDANDNEIDNEDRDTRLVRAISKLEEKFESTMDDTVSQEHNDLLLEQQAEQQQKLEEQHAKEIEEAELHEKEEVERKQQQEAEKQVSERTSGNGYNHPHPLLANTIPLNSFGAQRILHEQQMAHQKAQLKLNTLPVFCQKQRELCVAVATRDAKKISKALENLRIDHLNGNSTSTTKWQQVSERSERALMNTIIEYEPLLNQHYSLFFGSLASPPPLKMRTISLLFASLRFASLGAGHAPQQRKALLLEPHHGKDAVREAQGRQQL